MYDANGETSEEVYYELETTETGEYTLNGEPKDKLIECYPKLTVYEFNYDYIMSQQLFYPTVVASKLMNTMLMLRYGYGGNINFYDGILLGATPYTSKVLEKETGYQVVNGTESISGTTYNTAFLKEVPTLMAPNVTIEEGKTATITYTYNGDGAVTATSSSTNVATVEAIDTTAKTITIKGIAKGSTIIFLSAAEGTAYTAIAIEVNDNAIHNSILDNSEANAFWLINDGWEVKKDVWFKDIYRFGYYEGAHFVEDAVEEFERTSKYGIKVQIIRPLLYY